VALVAKRRWGMTDFEWGVARAALLELLVSVARSRSTVTYGEAARVAFGGRFSARSGALMDLLGDVDESVQLQRGVMLAALVVRKDSGIPGEGFFTFASEVLGREFEGKEEFWRAEAEAVWSAYDESEHR